MNPVFHQIIEVCEKNRHVDSEKEKTGAFIPGSSTYLFDCREKRRAVISVICSY